MGITVRCRQAELFRNHPSVSNVIYSGSAVASKGYDFHYHLGYDAKAGPDDYAAQLGVVLDDRHPRVYLDSFDVLRMQRFALSPANQLRIVIGAGAGDHSKLWDDDKWRQLCELLAQKFGANIVQMGDRGDRFFGYGCNLIGKLTAREAATVLKNSDLLISVDNGYGLLAEAVGQVGLIVSPRRDTSQIAIEGRSLVVVPGASDVHSMVDTRVKDIAVETVLEGIVTLSRREHLCKMERVLCA